jgi:hypothetical protein
MTDGDKVYTYSIYPDDSTTTYEDFSDYMPYPTETDYSGGGNVPPLMPYPSGISDLTARATWKEQPTKTEYSSTTDTAKDGKSSYTC